MLKALRLTPALRAAIDSVERAERHYLRGYESSGVIEIPKLGLADVVMAELAAQTAAERLRRLEGVPKPRPAMAVVARKRRRRTG